MKAKYQQRLLLSSLITLACSGVNAAMAPDVSAIIPLGATSNSTNISNPSFLSSHLMTLRPGGGPGGNGNGGGGQGNGGGGQGNGGGGQGNGGGGQGNGGGGQGNGGGGQGNGGGGQGNGGGGQGNGGGGQSKGGGGQGNGGNLDNQLRTLITAQNLDVSPTAGRNLPSNDDIMVQLGKSLFFANNLGGEQSVSCASCHHPNLGGGDELSLPVGVNAVDANDVVSPALLGHGRFQGNSDDNRPVIGRNSPTVFNMGLFDRGLFWDSRVEVINPQAGANGVGGQIITPDSATDAEGRRLPDGNLPQGTSLPAAQARFPVTSNEEMRGQFAVNDDNQSLRAQLNTRFDNSDVNYDSSWPVLFGEAYPDGEINFDRIAHALGEYERSMTFVNNPWQAYLAGDDSALTNQQKQGALLFFNSPQQGGAGCSGCHNGPTFSDGLHHLTAFPQIGPGAGDVGVAGANDDFGRERVTGNEADRYHFRTPSLLNVAVTAPYGHSGAYETLNEVVAHYRNPRGAVNRLFGAANGQAFANGNAPLCDNAQLSAISDKNGIDCAAVYPDAFANSRTALNRLRRARQDQVAATSPLPTNAPLNGGRAQAIVAFLNALTDPCVTNSDCMQPWSIDQDDVATFPDDNPLVAKDAQGDAL